MYLLFTARTTRRRVSSQAMMRIRRSRRRENVSMGEGRGRSSRAGAMTTACLERRPCDRSHQPPRDPTRRFLFPFRRKNQENRRGIFSYSLGPARGIDVVGGEGRRVCLVVVAVMLEVERATGGGCFAPFERAGCQVVPWVGNLRYWRWARESFASLGGKTLTAH